MRIIVQASAHPSSPPTKLSNHLREISVQHAPVAAAKTVHGDPWRGTEVQPVARHSLRDAANRENRSSNLDLVSDSNVEAIEQTGGDESPAVLDQRK
jgi:hypothetical protein